MAELLLPPAQADCVRRILCTHLPSDAKVSVFGSRARRDASAEFLSRLELGGTVELHPLPAEHG